MVHFIPLWSFGNNVLPEHKGKWIRRWAVISVWQHVGGKVHSGCKSNIRYVRLHLLLGQVFLRKGVWRTTATIGAEGTREAQPWDLQPISQTFAVIWPLLFFYPSLFHGRNPENHVVSWLLTRGRLSWFNCDLGITNPMRDLGIAYHSL